MRWRVRIGRLCRVLGFAVLLGPLAPVSRASAAGPLSWAQMNDPTGAANARFSPCSVYDSRRGQFLVLTGQTQSDCVMHSYYQSYPPWVLSADLTAPGPWVKHATNGGAHVWSAAAVYDSVGDRVWLFGGRYSNVTFYQTTNVFSDSLWAIDAGTMTWTFVPKSGPWPSPRVDPVLVLDAARNRLLLFGGEDSTHVMLNDLWSMNLSAPGAWTALAPGGAPPAGRSHALGAVDLDRDRLIVVGGMLAGGTASNDAWSLDLAGADGWAPLATSGAPAAGATWGAIDRVYDRLVAINAPDTLVVRALDLTTFAWSAPAVAGESPSAAGGRVQPFLSTALDPLGHRLLLAFPTPMLAYCSASNENSGPAYQLFLDARPPLTFTASLDSLSVFDGAISTKWGLQFDRPLDGPLQLEPRTPTTSLAPLRTFPAAPTPFYANDPAPPDEPRTYSFRWFDGATFQHTPDVVVTPPPIPSFLTVVRDTIYQHGHDNVVNFSVLGDSAHQLTRQFVQARLGAGPWRVLVSGFGWLPGIDPGVLPDTTYEYRVAWGTNAVNFASPIFPYRTPPVPQLTHVQTGWDFYDVAWHVKAGYPLHATVYERYYNGDFPLAALTPDSAGDFHYHATGLQPAQDHLLVLGYDVGGLTQYLAPFTVTTTGATAYLDSYTAAPTTLVLRWRVAPMQGNQIVLYRNTAGALAQLAELTPDAQGFAPYTDTGLEPDHAYVYTVYQSYNGGSFYVGDFHARTSPPNGPLVFALHAPAPNPASTTATIAFSLPAAQPAQVRVYDIGGRLRWSGTGSTPGTNTVIVDVRGLEPGLYVVKLDAGGKTQTQRLAVVK